MFVVVVVDFSFVIYCVAFSVLVDFVKSVGLVASPTTHKTKKKKKKKRTKTLFKYQKSMCAFFAFVGVFDSDFSPFYVFMCDV